MAEVRKGRCNPENSRGARYAAPLLVAVVLLLAGCSQSTGSASVAGSHLPKALRVTTSSGGSAAPSGLQQLSGMVEVTPTGPLVAPATITIHLTSPAPQGDAVLVRSSESEDGPWNWLPATLSTDRETVHLTTTHFSFFQVFGIDVGKAIDIFKRDFLDGFDSQATTDVGRPSCQGESVARSDGYTINSSTTNTVYWCFGMVGVGRVLKVTDDRRYPLQVLHPNLSVLDGGKIDAPQLSSLSHWGSGQSTIIGPGDSVTYQVNVGPGSQGGIQTTMDGMGQSLVALQVGVTALADILTKFGLGKSSTGWSATQQLLSSTSCVDALGQGPGAILASCLNPKALVRLFGLKALLLGPIVEAGALVAFFHSEWNAMVDQINGHGAYTVVIKNGSTAPSGPSSTTPATCLDTQTATHLFLGSGAVGIDGTEQIQQVTCIGTWAQGTIVHNSNGVGFVAYRYSNGSWQYATSSGFFSEYCSQMAQLGAPESLLADCPAGSTTPTTTTTTTTTTSTPTASCVDSAQLVAAWTASPGIYGTSGADGVQVVDFVGIQCWGTWVVATPETSPASNPGPWVFSQPGGLHAVSDNELSQFSAAVCADPSATPSDWTGPAGPASCS